MFIATTCDKELCVMATCVPNPIRFCYTSNESLLNKLSFSIKYVFYAYKDSLDMKR